MVPPSANKVNHVLLVQNTISPMSLTNFISCEGALARKIDFLVKKEGKKKKRKHCLLWITPSKFHPILSCNGINVWLHTCPNSYIAICSTRLSTDSIVGRHLPTPPIPLCHSRAPPLKFPSYNSCHLDALNFATCYMYVSWETTLSSHAPPEAAFKYPKFTPTPLAIFLHTAPDIVQVIMLFISSYTNFCLFNLLWSQGLYQEAA